MGETNSRKEKKKKKKKEFQSISFLSTNNLYSLYQN